MTNAVTSLARAAVLFTVMSGISAQVTCPTGLDRLICGLRLPSNLIALVSSGQATQNISAFCTDMGLPALKSALRCMHGRIMVCPGDQFSLPTLAEMEGALDHICQNVAGIDGVCMTERFGLVGSCVASRALQGGRSVNTSGVNILLNVCSLKSQLSSCLATTLNTCSRPRTGAILSQAVQNTCLA